MLKAKSTINGSMHTLHDFVNSITRHYQCVMQKDAVHIQTLEQMQIIKPNNHIYIYIYI